MRIATQPAFLLRQAVPAPAQAEACFQQALTIARQQQAKAWELRAVLSLARLWQQQGKYTAAYALLAPIYGWFTEGLDTAPTSRRRRRCWRPWRRRDAAGSGREAHWIVCVKRQPGFRTLLRRGTLHISNRRSNRLHGPL
jgi:hypothetical protein